MRNLKIGIKKDLNQIKKSIRKKKAAYQWGKEGEDLKIPSKNQKAESVFKHHYHLGYNEYEHKLNKLKATCGVGVAVLALAGVSWYRFRKNGMKKRELFNINRYPAKISLSGSWGALKSGVYNMGF